ncbi:MAG: class I SAM-dependent methyltransferase [bacterium]|nr:class I SAM-dependent methyltransferase [bacterium]
MNKIKILLKILITVIRNPKCLYTIISSDEEKDKRNYVIKKYSYKYGLPCIDLLDLFPEFEETIAPYSFLEGTSIVTDLGLLKALAKRYLRCRYLEIGTWRGESIVNIANIAEKCISIDLSKDEMKEKGYSTTFINLCDFFSKSLPNISYIKKDSQKLDFSVFKEKFDLIFIDGDHSYESIKKDTQNAFKVLKNSDSIIVWHDYFINAVEKIKWSVLAGILDGCPKEKRGNLYYVSNTLCAIYIQGDFKAKFITSLQTPNKTFTVKLSAKKLI